MTKTLRIEFNFTQDEWARISRFYSEDSIRHLLWVSGKRGLFGEIGIQEKFAPPKKAAAGEKSLTLHHRRRNR